MPDRRNHGIAGGDGTPPLHHENILSQFWGIDNSPFLKYYRDNAARHCERSEAVQKIAQKLDCHGGKGSRLAMTAPVTRQTLSQTITSDL
ncbi:MAG: hypothetical protein FWC62_07850 [Firmicutes bacterium]|nr:hypothetical protein [Bacillota bacterium]